MWSKKAGRVVETFVVGQLLLQQVFLTHSLLPTMRKPLNVFLELFDVIKILSIPCKNYQSE